MGTYNASQYAQELRKRQGAVSGAMREATAQATDFLHAESKRLMNDLIYSIPEDRTEASFRRKRGGGFQTNKEGKRLSYTNVTNATGVTGKTGTRKVGREGGTRVFYHKDDAERATGGRKKWTRIGNLRRSERKQVLSAMQGVVENDAAYALPRHNLGLGPGDPEAIPPTPSRKRNTTRIAPFRQRAITRTRNQRFNAYRVALKSVLG